MATKKIKVPFFYILHFFALLLAVLVGEAIVSVFNISKTEELKEDYRNLKDEIRMLKIEADELRQSINYKSAMMIIDVDEFLKYQKDKNHQIQLE